MDRREFLSVSLVVPVSLTLVRRVGAQAKPTPACGAPTVSQTEGPYFKPSSPERQSLIEPSTKGTRIVVEGTVLDTDCRPIPKALLDVWHADAAGEYDNSGFRMRGHQ